jgi:hypothetical protein
MSEFDIILDSSQQNLKEVPTKILEMSHLKMLYLQQNFIKELPKNFFLKLPHLTWLDLRNNHMSGIPASVAHHQHLENLLLSDNKIEALPNELGLVPNLKVLQLANNPLAYPNSRVVAEGTKAVCAYLRHQYEKVTPSANVHQIPVQTHQEEKELRDEKEIRVMADYCNEFFPMQESMESSLMVRGLSKVKKEDSGIVHKMTQSPNKLLIKSYFDPDDKHVKASTQTSNYSFGSNALKSTWMDKLKHLLDQQEKVLQEERLDKLSKLIRTVKSGVCRNLQALGAWQYQKKSEPVRQIPREEYNKPPPYATDPEYNSMLTREEMQKEIDKMIAHHRCPPKKQDLEKLIGELVAQLKDMETSYGGVRSPKSEIEEAGSQMLKVGGRGRRRKTTETSETRRFESGTFNFKAGLQRLEFRK